jgi:hypothetical protein
MEVTIIKKSNVKNRGEIKTNDLVNSNIDKKKQEGSNDLLAEY